MAVHILAFLARDRDEHTTSEEIARSVNTNPVVIRRLLGMLQRAGLVCGQPGARGGSKLCVDPKEISLFDIFGAVDQGEPISLHEDPDQRCPVGRRIQCVLENVSSGVNRAVAKELKETSLNDVLASIQRIRKA